MKKRVPVTEIMTKEVVTLLPTQPLQDAEKLFETYDIRHIPVVEGERVVGVLSKSDLMKITYVDVANDNSRNVIYDMYTIPQVMTKNPVTMDAGVTIREAAEMLTEQSFHSMPVTDNGKLVGMLTTTDFINYLLDQY